MTGHMCSMRYRYPAAEIHHSRVLGELRFGSIFRGQQISPQQCFHCEKFPHTCVKVRHGLGSVGSFR